MNDLLKVCEVKLVYKTSYNINKRPQIRSDKDSYRIFKKFWDMDTIEHRESFKMLLLNRANRVLGICSIAEGGINGIIMDVKIIMQYALNANATSIILCHNHPSGNLDSGIDDKNVTSKIQKACELLGIELLDHLVITKSAYKSII